MRLGSIGEAMSRRKQKPKKLTQENVLSTSAYTKLLKAANEIRQGARQFGVKPDKAYSLVITALLTASMRQFLEVRHAQGEDRRILNPSQEIEVMEDLVHDVGAFLCGMMEDRDPESEYGVEFARKGD